MEYRVVKQLSYKGDYKTEVLCNTDSYKHACKELMKAIRKDGFELLEYSCTIGVVDDLGKLLVYFYNKGE